MNDIIKTFFSCSFDDEDKDVVDYFLSIAVAFSCFCDNVKTASSINPPEKARQMIKESDMVIAIATKRKKSIDDKWSMPDAVLQELSFAYALNKPVVLFVEDDVELLGFTKSISTYYVFSRKLISSSQQNAEIIKAFFDVRKEMDASSYIEPQLGHETESLRCNTRGEYSETGLMWKTSMSKQVVFTEKKVEPIVVDYYIDDTTENSDGIDSLFTSSLNIEKMGCKYVYNVDTSKSEKGVHYSITFDRNPEIGDRMLITQCASSQYYINDASGEEAEIVFEGKKYACQDMVGVMSKTYKLQQVLEIDKAYGLKVEDVVVFSGTAVYPLNYIIIDYKETERCRLGFHADDIGYAIRFTLELENPVINNRYYFAWNTPR